MNNNLGTSIVYTVSQLTRSLKTILESKFRFIRVSGEVSNLRTPFSGHSYFTLKDKNAQVRAVLFKQQKRFNSFQIEDGKEVVVFGRLSVYEPRGDYQIIVDTIELQGAGDLQKKFDQLKSKLKDQGYFDQDKKKTIPLFPRKIAIISSPTGAAIQDYLKVAKLRESDVSLLVIPVRVQGTEAPNEIASAIKIANEHNDIDIIVLCRGGGSIEDLWAFNEEKVADAIFKSKTVVVTGIGHETDFTIADFSADYRAPTPTSAGEQTLPDTNYFKDLIEQQQLALCALMRYKLESYDKRIQYAMKYLGDLNAIVQNSEYRLQISTTYLMSSIEKRISSLEQSLLQAKTGLVAKSPINELTIQEHSLAHLVSRFEKNMQLHVERKQAHLAKQADTLNSLSPLSTLARGYSVTKKYDASKNKYVIITDSREVEPGESVSVKLKKGEIKCRVTKV